MSYKSIHQVLLAMLLLLQCSSIVLLVGASFVPAVTFGSRRHQFTDHSPCADIDRTSTMGTRSGATSNSCLWASLYDILGASPNDSHEVLRRKYTDLAKQTHPDAMIGKTIDNSVNDGKPSKSFHEIAAAWQVLSDPKERLRYDRQLKAKQFTESFESILDTGLSVGLPFLQKTADTTMAAAEVTGKTMFQFGTQMDKARTIFDLENRKRELEQQAAREDVKAMQLRKQIDSLQENRLDILTNPTTPITNSQQKQQQLNTVRAQQVLQSLTSTTGNFGMPLSAPPPLPLVKNEIKTLKEREEDYYKKLREANEVDRAVMLAERQLEDAIRAEIVAQERLEQAKRNVEQAKITVEESKKKSIDLTGKQKSTNMAMTKSTTALEQTTEKVRLALLKQEDKSLEYRAVALEQERIKTLKHAKLLREKAAEIGKQVEQRKRDDQGL